MNFKALLSSLFIIPIAHTSYSQCNEPSSRRYMDINNVRALIHNGGDMWWDLVGSSEYEFPIGSGISPFFAGSIWIGGTTSTGDIQVAANRYRANGTDFYPGPLTPQGTTTLELCNQFDMIFSMYKAEVDDFLSSGTISQDILNWPGKGNPNNNTPDMPLAPFVDVNNDGIYDPYDGDYPNIKGDFALWNVFNDVGGLHGETGSNPIGIEIHQMTYAYQASGVVNNSIFYDYTVVKKTPGSLSDTYFGTFADTDLGNPMDDYLASSSSKRLGIGYNGDPVDESAGGAIGYEANPPATGIKILQTPTHNDSSLTDLSSFIMFINGGGPGVGDPTISFEFYNYLTGKWRDGEDVVLGGIGRIASNPGAPVYPFMFDVDAPQEWTECSTGNTPGDRRFIMSCGPFNLNQGEYIEYSTVSYSIFPSSGLLNFSCDSLAPMLDAADSLQAFFDTIPEIFVGVDDLELTDDQFSIYPNPSKGMFTLSSSLEDVVNIQLFDLSGRVIKQWESADQQQTFTVEDAGVYILHISQADQKVVKKLVVH